MSVVTGLRKAVSIAPARKGLPFPAPHLLVPVAAAMVGLVLIATLVLGVFLVGRHRAGLHREKEKMAATLVGHFASGAAIPLLGDDSLALNALVKETGRGSGVLYAAVLDRGSVVRAHSDPVMIGFPFRNPGGPREVTPDGAVTRAVFALPSGVRVLELSRPVAFMGKAMGSAHVGFSLDAVDAETKREALSAAYGLLLPASILIVIAAATSFLLVERLRRAEARPAPPMRGAAGGREPSFAAHLPAREDGDPAGLPAAGNARNPVTVLYASVKGFKTYADARDVEKVMKDLNDVFAIARSAIMSYGGSIDKHVGDAVIGVFGRLSYQADHTRRAVRAAVSMTGRLREEGGDGNPLLRMVGIGISTGVVLAGQVHSGEKSEHIFIGESFKAAGSLNTMAGPGEIVIGKDVYQAVRSLVSVEPLPPQGTGEGAGSWESFRLLKIEERRSPR